MFYSTGPWAQSLKSFYGRNLGMFIMTYVLGRPFQLSIRCFTQVDYGPYQQILD